MIVGYDTSGCLCAINDESRGSGTGQVMFQLFNRIVNSISIGDILLCKWKHACLKVNY
jgi:hypothetical protein